MGLRRLAKMLFTYRMPGFLSVSRQPESTRLVPMWPGMRLRLIDSFPGQPCASRERVARAQRAPGEGTFQAKTLCLRRPLTLPLLRNGSLPLPRCGRGDVWRSVLVLLVLGVAT